MMAQDKHKHRQMLTVPNPDALSDSQIANCKYANNTRPTINNGTSTESKFIIGRKVDGNSGRGINNRSTLFTKPTIPGMRDIASPGSRSAPRRPDWTTSSQGSDDSHRTKVSLAPPVSQHPVGTRSRLCQEYIPNQTAHVAPPFPMPRLPLNTEPTSESLNENKLRLPLSIPVSTILIPDFTECRKASLTEDAHSPAAGPTDTKSESDCITERELFRRLNASDPVPSSSRTITKHTINPEKTEVRRGGSSPTPLPFSSLAHPEITDPHVPIILTTNADSKSMDDHLSHEILLLDPFTTTLSKLRSTILSFTFSSETQRNLKLYGKLLDPNSISVAWRSGILQDTVTVVHEGNVKAVLVLLGKSIGKEALSVKIEKGRTRTRKLFYRAPTMRSSQPTGRKPPSETDSNLDNASDNESAIDARYASSPQFPSYHGPDPTAPAFRCHPRHPVGGLPPLAAPQENLQEDHGESPIEFESKGQEEVSTTPPTPAAGLSISSAGQAGSSTVTPALAPTILNRSLAVSSTRVPIIIKIQGAFKCHEIILVNPETITLPVLENCVVETVRANRNLYRRGNIRPGGSLNRVRLCVAWEEGYLGGNSIKTNVHEENVKAVMALLGEMGGREALLKLATQAATRQLSDDSEQARPYSQHPYIHSIVGVLAILNSCNMFDVLPNLVSLPFYAYFRLILLSYLVLPQTQGARLLYQSHIHPFLAHYEADIDNLISNAHDRARSAGLQYLKRAIDFVRENIFGIQPKKQSHVSAAGEGSGSYAQNLLSRFNLPSAREGLAAPAGDFYGLLSAALGQASTKTAGNNSTTQEAQLDHLFATIPPIPQTITSPTEKLTFLTTQ
ncbi:MAG: hypothetical protein Q9187_006448, partial [Circinaria calcarea]